MDATGSSSNAGAASRVRISTDRQVAGLQPRAERYEVTIKGAPGLIAIVYPTGTRMFVLRYTAPTGERRRLPLGRYSTAFGLADARLHANIHRVAIDAGGDPAAERARTRKSARTGETLDDLQKAYLKAAALGLHGGRQRPRRPASLAHDDTVYKNHIQQKLGHKPYAQLHKSDLKEFLRQLATDSGLAAASVRAVLGVLRGILSFAVHEEKIATNPALGLKVAKANERVRMFDEASLRAFWRALHEASHPQPEPLDGASVKSPGLDPQTAMCIRLLMMTAVRRTEAAGARWDEFDFNTKVWTVPGGRMKSGRPHTVPLCESALRLLALIEASTAHRKSPFLFPAPGDSSKPIRGDGITYQFAALCDHLDLPRFSPHDVRRTCATTLTGERYRIRQFIAGHVLAHGVSDGAAITGRYDLTSYLAEKREALTIWAGHLDAMLTDPDGDAAGQVLRFKPRGVS